MNKQVEQNLGRQLQGEREVTLSNGQTHIVFFSLRSIINLQSKYGSLGAVFSEFSKEQDMDFEVFLDFLYEGMKTRDKDVTKEYIADNINFFEFGEIVGQVFGTLQDSLPSDEKNE